MAIPSVVAAGLMFVVGVALIVYSVEELVENIAKAAVVTGLSTFILAVLFAGMDFENWAFGVASMVGDLPGVAIGSALGSGLFLVGTAVALGGFLTPFETEIDRDYLGILLLSPLVLLLFIVDGTLSRLDGVGLLLVFGLLIAYIYREEATGRETFRTKRQRKHKRTLPRRVVAGGTTSASRFCSWAGSWSARSWLFVVHVASCPRSVSTRRCSA